MEKDRVKYLHFDRQKTLKKGYICYNMYNMF